MNWLSIFNPLVKVFNGWRDRKHEIKLLKHDLKKTTVIAESDIKKAKAMAAVERIGQRQEADINWELLSIRNSGWRDEYLTLFTTAIVAMVFLPWTQPFMMEGFTQLNATPYWFQVVIVIVYSSAFGVRAFKSFKSILPRGGPKSSVTVK